MPSGLVTQAALKHSTTSDTCVGIILHDPRRENKQKKKWSRALI
jgi:hypothetical protein